MSMTASKLLRKAERLHSDAQDLLGYMEVWNKSHPDEQLTGLSLADDITCDLKDLVQLLGDVLVESAASESGGE